jgi:hypothetical protein
MASHDQHHDINICDAGRLGDEEHTGVEFKVLYTWPPMNNLILMKNQTQEGSTIATLAH